MRGGDETKGGRRGALHGARAERSRVGRQDRGDCVLPRARVPVLGVSW
jgi:hypothetical protein